MFLVALLLPPSIPWAQEFEVAAVKPQAAGAPSGESNTYPEAGWLSVASPSLK